MSSSKNNIKVIGKAIKVVEHDGLTIEEAIGNVSTSNDEVSVAIVSITKPTSEPWLTLHYDEWMYVTEGFIELHQENDDGSKVIVKASEGETVFIPKGSRFQPVFPVAPVKYIPVCLPAFKPERCIREEGTELSDVSLRLKELHSHDAKKSLSAKEINEQFNNITKFYHMCQKDLYDECCKFNMAYFPPTFKQDGFTHATAEAKSLITTANHFYTKTEGEWVCLELDRSMLEKKCGIMTIFESAMPVGDIETNWKDAVFPHIYGGIPLNTTGVVTNVFKMNRDDDGTFLGIEGLSS